MRVSRPATLLTLAFALASVSVPAAAQPADHVGDPAFERVIADIPKVIMSNPAQALASAKTAEGLARRLPDVRRREVALATAKWLQAESLIFLNETAPATGLIEQALAATEKVAPGTKLHGNLLRSRGTVAAFTGKTLQALREYQRAHDVFQRVGEPRNRALTLQDIALIYYDAGDYDRVLEYTRQAEEAYPNDPRLTLTFRNNRAEVYRKQKKFDLAAAEYRAALTQAKKLGSHLLQVRIHTNLAISEAEAGRLPQAQAAVDQASRLAVHGEAAGWRPFVWGAAAEVAIGKRQYREAATLLERTFAGVDLTTSDVQYLEHHQAAARVYEELGDSALALKHLKASQRLESEAQRLTASAASQLMAARFDFTNQNLQIVKLRQEQQARELEAEREGSRTRTILFSVLLIAGAFIVGVLLFGYVAARRSRDAVRAANGSLTEVNDRLEKALKAKTEFLATTSHEIRTPLNGILGMTQVLLADRAVEAGVRERIKVVHGAGETMKALVDDILDVAKIESGELVVHHEPCDLRAILEDAARLWSGQAEAKGLELRLEIAGVPERIMSDTARLRQIVFNLMSNALKFTAEGGVTLRAETEAADGAESLRLTVEDTGIGIPADKLDEIFEAFRQVDSGTTRQFGGTGLGLAICRRIGEKLGGDVSVESELGRGTRFTLHLPLERASAEVADDAVEGESPLAGSRVLLLDRNPANQGVMRLMLCAEGAFVMIAEDAPAAIAALDAGEVGHLLVDAASLADEGVETLSALRELVGSARQAGARCTVLLSPAAAGVSVAEAMMLGASQLVVKPIAAPDLIAALGSLYGDEPEGFVAPALLQAA
jgi:signal transduction histidine kinase/ActR/RegA family two-component response regulator